MTPYIYPIPTQQEANFPWQHSHRLTRTTAGSTCLIGPCDQLYPAPQASVPAYCSNRIVANNDRIVLKKTPPRMTDRKQLVFSYRAKAYPIPPTPFHT